MTDHVVTAADVWRRQADQYVAPAAEVPPTRPRLVVLRRLVSRPRGAIALGVLLVIGLAAALAPVIAPYDPLVQDLTSSLRGPSGSHLLGTDELGRDVLSRLIHGARVSMLAGLGSAGVAVAAGVIPGLAAGYLGGIVDRLLSMVADALMALPAIILAIAVLAALGPGLRNTALAIGIVTAPRVFRLVRGAAMATTGEVFIESARATGLPSWRIIARHVLPNTLSPIVIFVALVIGRSILAEASLSFIGLGVRDPDPSWGSMLARAGRFADRAPWLLWVPGLAIAITVLTFNAFGDALRGAFGRGDGGR